MTTATDTQAQPTPSVRVVEESASFKLVRQHVEAEAFGSPSEARRIGAALVDKHDEALRRLAES